MIRAVWHNTSIPWMGNSVVWVFRLITQESWPLDFSFTAWFQSLWIIQCFRTAILRSYLFRYPARGVCKTIPATDVSLGQCFQLHESSSTPAEQFSYDPTLRQCYPTVPKLPVNFSCSLEEASVLTLQSLVEDGDPVYGAPHKLNMSGRL